MGIRCLLNGVEVNYPCSSVCELFGDCVIAFNEQKKANVRTNADCFRVMSDEELSDILYQFAHSNKKPLSKMRLLKWLKQSAEMPEEE